MESICIITYMLVLIIQLTILCRGGSAAIGRPEKGSSKRYLSKWLKKRAKLHQDAIFILIRRSCASRMSTLVLVHSKSSFVHFYAD